MLPVAGSRYAYMCNSIVSERRSGTHRSRRTRLTYAARMSTEVTVVPHTHWDREWYLPFQRFRLRLVDLLDGLLDHIEQDPSYTHFLLDGQMAVVDDYLELRPEAEPRLRRLAAAGRLAMGPWYILPDEFLVSGETLIRDLALGLERGASFGGAMPVGYLPDMFGHIAQMPQILSQFGLEHAVVWRGVPAAMTDRTAFWWEAPDGTTVRTEYLPQGYGNGADLPDDASFVAARMKEFIDEHDQRLGGRLLWMNGTDHQMPRPWLGRVVAEVDAKESELSVRVGSLASYLADAPVDGLPRWTGELRSGARANLLMGVASNRVDVKQAAARAERWLERIAEPMSALFADRWPAAELDLAWREVIRNSAHDSICACSHDEVVAAVLHRFDEARQIAEGLTTRALRDLADRLPVAGPAVVNASARTRGGVVELELPYPPEGGADAGHEDAPPVQILADAPPQEHIHSITRADAATVIDREIDLHPDITEIEVGQYADGTLTITIHTDPADGGPILRRELTERLTTLAADRPDGAVDVHLTRPGNRRALVRVDDVPGYGWRTWDAVPSTHPPVEATETRLHNGLVTVQVDRLTGTFSLDGHAGMGRLVDDGDRGDTYNWCPPADHRAVDRPAAVEVEVVERGPVRARLLVTRTYPLPERIVDEERIGRVDTTVTTTLELRQGEPFLRIGIELDNQTRDHRLRLWFPLPETATGSSAECAFATVERGLEAEGGPTERPLATFPSRRFVRAGGVTMAHEGLLEYELVDIDDGGAHALALTLLRCTGMLSQGPMITRPLPAGPEDPLEGPQMQGAFSARLVLATGPVDPYALADDAFTPLMVALPRRGGESRAAVHQELDITGAEVSSVRRVDGMLEVRVFNPGAQPTRVSVAGRQGWVLDLRGRTLGRFDEHLDLSPGRIATLRLHPAAT